MNTIELARQAYAGTTAPIRTARQAEHQVFSTVTARLQGASTSSEPDAFVQLAGAVHDNRRLWTRLAIDVADKDNALPQDLRARIFYLAEFTGHHSARVLRGEGDVRVLIEINTAIMRGLGALPSLSSAPRGPQ